MKEVVIPPANWADENIPNLTNENIDRIARGLLRVTDPSITRRLAVQLQQANEKILFNIKRHQDLEAQLRRERDEARGWIAISYKLPSIEDGYVLWACTNGEVMEGYYDPWCNGMQFWRAARTPNIPRSLTEVTHWQPLPAPPTAAQPAQEQP